MLAGRDPCRLRHRGESKPRRFSAVVDGRIDGTYPHGRVESASNLIVLLQPRAAPQDLGQPKLPRAALGMSDFAMRRRWRFDPMGRLPGYPTDQIGVGQRFGSLVVCLDAQRRQRRLGDA